MTKLTQTIRWTPANQKPKISGIYFVTMYNTSGEIKMAEIPYDTEKDIWDISEYSGFIVSGWTLCIEPQNNWVLYSYDKDNDYYQVEKTGTFEELYSQLDEMYEKCKNEDIRNKCNNEPCDWVFMEPAMSHGALPPILPTELR